MASKPRPQFAPNDPRVIALQKAVKIAGGQAALARMVGISPQGLWWWGICPAERCQQVSQLTGVSVHELRPEVFGAAAINRQEINMDDGFQNVVLRELQRFVEIEKRKAIAQEDTAAALTRIADAMWDRNKLEAAKVQKS